MPPRADDVDGIHDDCRLIRVLVKASWLQLDKNSGNLRPTSDSIQDGNSEASFFIEGEVHIEEIQGLFPGRRLVIIPAAILREAGFWIERRPDEAPDNLSCGEAHVVVGPPREIPRNVYIRACRLVVKNPAVVII